MQSLPTYSAKWLKDPRLLTLVDQGIGSGVNFLVGALLARELGLEAFGHFAMLWLVLQALSSLAQALLIQPLMSLGPGRKDFAAFSAALWGAAWIWWTAAALIGCLAALASPLYGWPALEAYRWVFPFWIMASGLLDQLRRQALSNGNPRRALWINATGQGLALIGLIVLFASGRLTGPSAMACLGLGPGIAVLLGSLGHPAPIWGRKVPAGLAGECWHYSRWLLGTAVLQWCSGQGYAVLTGALLGPAALGILRLAQQVMGLVHVLYQAVENYVPVSAARLYRASGPERMYRYLVHSGWRMVLGNILLLFALILGREPLYRLFFGPAHLDAAWMLAALTPAYAFIVPAMPFRFAARSLGQTSDILLAYTGAAVFTLSTAPWLLGQFGLTGAAIGLAGNQMILFLLLGWPQRKAWISSWQSYTQSSAKPIPNA